MTRSDDCDVSNREPEPPTREIWAKGGPVFSPLEKRTVQDIEARAIASFGDSATLGMWAFATGACLSGLFQSNLLPKPQEVTIFPALLVHAGLIEIIAGLFLFRRNNSFLATAFCSFGAFNLTRSILMLAEHGGLVPSGTGHVVQGVLSEIFAYIALSLFFGAVRMNAVLVCVTLATTGGFALAGIPFLAGRQTGAIWGELGRIGGYCMLAASAGAFYGGTAMQVNTAWKRQLIPIGGRA